MSSLSSNQAISNNFSENYDSSESQIVQTSVENSVYTMSVGSTVVQTLVEENKQVSEENKGEVSDLTQKPSQEYSQAISQDYSGSEIYSQSLGSKPSNISQKSSLPEGSVEYKDSKIGLGDDGSNSKSSFPEVKSSEGRSQITPEVVEGESQITPEVVEGVSQIAPEVVEGAPEISSQVVNEPNQVEPENEEILNKGHREAMSEYRNIKVDKVYTKEGSNDK